MGLDFRKKTWSSAMHGVYCTVVKRVLCKMWVWRRIEMIKWINEVSNEKSKGGNNTFVDNDKEKG